MPNQVEFRWLHNDEVIEFVNPALKERGMPQLNVNDLQPTCRVLGAFLDSRPVMCFCLQLFPILGPLVKLDGEFRDGGDISRTLATMMSEFLAQTEARGWLVICDSPISERLAQRHKMTKLESPVYLGSTAKDVVGMGGG